MDGLAIAGLSSGIVAILVAVFTHLKHSECCGFKLDTYTPNELQPQIVISQPTTPHNTPQITAKSQETNL
jgi:hypothetical protein